MKIQYLGTAAFEGIPAFFCDCDVCTEARKRGGKNIRTRSQMIIDDRLLVDFPADTYMHFLQYDLPLKDINACIITHSHSDHLYPMDFEARKKGMCNIKHDRALKIYGGRDTYDKTVAAIEKLGISPFDLQAELVNPFETFDADGYTVTALNAAHDPTSTPYIYLIEKDGKILFYSNDTGMYYQDTWDFLATYGKVIDLVSFDCTMGQNETTYYGHFGFNECVEVRKKFYEMGICDEHTKFVLTHFSHNGKNALYDDMLIAAKENDFELAYDGMVIEF